MLLDQLLPVARGERPADLLLRNARVVNVFTGELETTDVAIASGVIVGVGPGYRAAQERDLAGRVLAPGFMDAHMHVESAMVPPAEFARAVVPQGTTTVVIDPHEIANVFGAAGIDYLLAAREGIPLDVFVMLPSAVPASHMETAGAALSAADLAPFMQHPAVLGVGEMMNFPGVIAGDPEVLRRAAIAGAKRVDGHAPGVRDQALNAYILAGVGSDHECTTVAEAEQRLRRGMYLMIREASNARNLAALLPAVTPANSRRCLLVTDDRTPADLLDEGHINFLVRKAIGLGLDPVIAVQMATLNVAEYFGLRGRGAIAPGYRADMVVLDDLSADFAVLEVYRAGALVAANGQLLAESRTGVPPLPNSVHLPALTAASFAIPAAGERARIIGLVPDQIVTRALSDTVRVENGMAVADPERDILKLAVIERHGRGGAVGLGFVQGFGLREGALASSVAHDSHNIIVVGTNDADMLAAAQALAGMQGGQVAVAGGTVLAAVPLPIAGLMSDQPVETVRAQVDALNAATRGLGCPLHAPFMALSFLALPVIPSLKLTDQGVVDVEQFALVPLFEDAQD
ncbi:adenosine deaminase [Kouleothrix aurantiaca]|uniref:Adenine deaminase n=1 Tax=Kouleothrix aurantiaca TaxID=186479 RepID=A0A0P9HCX6_9CHLR|nr:adenosine deaminase [Kouleothrix aurantiaca]